jgi:hypothetical protein
MLRESVPKEATVAFRLTHLKFLQNPNALQQPI